MTQIFNNVFIIEIIATSNFNNFCVCPTVMSLPHRINQRVIADKEVTPPESTTEVREFVRLTSIVVLDISVILVGSVIN